MQTAVETATPTDPEYDSLYKQLLAAQNERDEASRELQRLRDFKPATSTDKKASGYQLYQLLLVAVAFLLLGAMLGKYERHHGIKLPLAQ